MKKTFQLCALFLLALAVAGAPAAAQSYDAAEPSVGTAADTGSYSYLRVVEGSATLTQGDTGDREEARLHQPVLAGDRLWVSPNSRLEIVLSDYNRLRLDEGTEVSFERLAASPDGRDDETALRLHSGNLQLVVTEGYLGSAPPRLELPFATVFVREPGSYRTECYDYDVCWVVVRGGSVEVLTDRGSLLVRSGEAAFLEKQGELPQVSIETATSWDDLERWGERLEIEARRADLRGIDESLQYAAAPLDDHGDWLDVDDGWAWRPHASADWRPYWRGSWRSTPSGLFWISNEPWGHVTHHYGTWSFHAHHGWIWHPGNVFAPAWVYWYWGPRHVAWVPAGYYTHYYRPRFSTFSFHFGVYGHAGGSFHHFRDWVFCDIDFFRRHHHRRDFHHRLHHGHALERAHRGDVVPRGLITTDTRGLEPGRWDDPERALRDLAHRRGTRADAVPRLGGGDTLPDVTPFVARESDLPEPVRRTVVSSRNPDDRPLRAGTPFGDRPLRSADSADLDRPTPSRRTVSSTERPLRTERPAEGPRERPTEPPTRSTRGWSADRTDRADRSSDRPTRVTVRPRTPETTTRRPETSDRPTRVERPRTSERPLRTDRPTTRSSPPSRTPAPRTVRPRTVEPWAGNGDRPTRRDTPQAAPERRTRPEAAPQRPPRADAPSERPSASDRPSGWTQRERRPSTSDRPIRSQRPTTSSRTPARRPTTSSRGPSRTPTSVRTPRPTRRPTTSRSPTSRSRSPSASPSRPLRRPSAGSSSSSPRSRPSTSRPSRSSGSKPSARSSSGRSGGSKSSASSRSRRSSGSRGGAKSRGRAQSSGGGS